MYVYMQKICIYIYTEEIFTHQTGVEGSFSARNFPWAVAQAKGRVSDIRSTALRRTDSAFQCSSHL